MRKRELGLEGVVYYTHKHAVFDGMDVINHQVRYGIVTYVHKNRRRVLVDEHLIYSCRSQSVRVDMPPGGQPAAHPTQITWFWSPDLPAFHSFFPLSTNHHHELFSTATQFLSRSGRTLSLSPPIRTPRSVSPDWACLNQALFPGYRTRAYSLYRGKTLRLLRVLGVRTSWPTRVVLKPSLRIRGTAYEFWMNA